MIERVESERVDYAIDQFEENWSANSVDQISQLLSDFRLSDSPEGITELIRIDIELRYRAKLPVELDDYLSRFPLLQTAPKNVGRVAFEDFRGREDCGLPTPLSRWKDLPGVQNEHWFQKLVVEASLSRAERRIAELEQQKLNPESAFELALASAGFRLIQEIGRGAFSHVYLATQNELAGRFVVLKVVSQTLSEPQSMAMLLHTNIVPIYSFHRIDNRNVICMPYAGSVTLDDFLQSRTNTALRSGQSLIDTVQARVDDTKIALEKAESDEELFAPAPAANEHAALNPLASLESLSCSQLATILFEKLAAGLAHSHARGVLHGDLKPANVLIRNDGEPAILDFNLSSSLQGPRSTHVGGTLAYMSPESLRAFMGDEHANNAASDIYSLGMMLFEFLTGELPYPAPVSIAPMDLHPAVQQRQTPIEISDERISPGLRVIVKRCLEFSPNDRYQSADELQQDLECENSSLPLANAIEPRSNRIRKWLRRHPRATSSGTVAAALLAVLIPLGVIARASYKNSQQLSATLAFADFSADSERILSRIVAEPKRSLDYQVSQGTKPLHDFGVMGDSPVDRFLTSQQPPELRQTIRIVVHRHICHLCFVETARLRRAHSIDPQHEADLSLIDQLIAVSQRLTDSGNSRAVMFMRSDRAELAGDTELARSLSRQANELPIDSPTEAYLEGTRLLILRQHAKAIDALLPFASDESVPIQLRAAVLGQAQYKARRYEEAKISFTQVINRAPNSAHFLVLRGLCYKQMGAYDRSLADLSKGLEMTPQNTKALIARGDILLKRGELRNAIRDYSEILRYAPGTIHVLLQRAEAYEQLGDDTLAERDRLAAYASDKVTAQALLSRAKARNDDDPDAAIADLLLANSLDPELAVIHWQLAFVYAVHLKDYEAAVRCLDDFLRLQPRNQSGTIDRALSHVRLKHFALASADLEAATSKAPTGRTLYQAACVCALMPGRDNHIDGLRFLSLALRAGYDAKNLKTDPDLETLRAMDGFRGILKTYQLSKIVRPKKSER